MVEKHLVMGVTGASGGLYALRLLDLLEASGAHIHLVISPHGRRLLADECGVTTVTAEALLGRDSRRLTLHGFRDLAAPPASGSFLTAGMVVCPCSSNTLGMIASGLGDNLITRAAQVTLKECRRLVLVHREMPLSALDLENMLRLRHAGAVICPAAPAFYMGPRSIADLVDFVAGKVLDLLGVPHALNTRWTGAPGQVDSEETGG